VTALVASFFADDIAVEVERSQYPGERSARRCRCGARSPRRQDRAARRPGLPHGAAIPAVRRLRCGVLLSGDGVPAGREYFELAAMRFHPPAEAKRLRKLHHGTVFLAAWSSRLRVDPVVNLATHCSAWRSWCICTTAGAAAADRR